MLKATSKHSDEAPFVKTAKTLKYISASLTINQTNYTLKYQAESKKRDEQRGRKVYYYSLKLKIEGRKTEVDKTIGCLEERMNTKEINQPY